MVAILTKDERLAARLIQRQKKLDIVRAMGRRQKMRQIRRIRWAIRHWPVHCFGFPN